MSLHELLCGTAYCVLMLVFATVISVAFFSGYSRLGERLLYSYCVILFAIVIIGRCL